MNMQPVTLKDKQFKPYIPADELQRIVARLGEQISSDYAGKSPVFLSVLNGAFMFGADLMKHIDR